jgi:hypothetical protein
LFEQPLAVLPWHDQSIGSTAFLEGTVLSFQAMSKSNLTICVLRLAVAVVLRRAVAFLVHAWSGGHSALFSDPDTVSLMADFVGEDYTLKRGSRRFFTL